MDEGTASALDAINRRFYEACADEFDARRRASWPGWTRCWDAIVAERDPASVLDLGCGNGRFVSFLRQRAERVPEYWGVDRSKGLLAHARGRAADHGGDHWIEAELLDTAWPAQVGTRCFDVVLLIAVLHHIPGPERRRALLARAATRLAAGGALLLSLWRLDEFPRLATRRLPWNTAAVPGGAHIDQAQLSPDDHLLRWGSTGGAARYCCTVDEVEARAALADAGLGRVLSIDASDLGEPNRYLIARR